MNTLLVLLGPTGVGKTEWSIRLAKALNTPVVSADSRQIYRGMQIATAAPTAEEQEQAAHFFVGTLSPETYYSASAYEQEVLSLLEELFLQHTVVILSGGSMLYIDAVCKGMDELPTVDEELRNQLRELYLREGLDPIRQQLKIVDPLFYSQVDLKNPQRVIHALEICLMSGKPYSSLRTNRDKKRPFRIVKIGFTRDREDLYDRINRRVDKMVLEGLVEEARGFYPMRHLNSLNTVGYKELFRYFDGDWSLEQAIEKIKQHSRNYARKQLTWFRRDNAVHWVNLTDKEQDVMELASSLLEREQ
ncbi:MAG: tRNA (adenosine(37)-N6)-dimethylallyltransferase MiaA [Bacteroidales bacterium]|jgi:tRNA dimethylallyltransferase|nr:tRNA (adenosine(37)-N6)-dimethylallyltransferase MiaA [Bacteroidales bacterium]